MSPRCPCKDHQALYASRRWWTERRATAAIIALVWIPGSILAWLISGSVAFLPAGVIFGAWRAWDYLRSHPVIRCEMREGRCKAADECPCWQEGWRDSLAERRRPVECPDCRDTPHEPGSHADDCPRIGTSVQMGPPWLPIPPTEQVRP